MALELQDPTYGSPAFVNASGNGMNKWMSLDYGGLTNAAFQGVLLQPSFSNINTDNPDLSAFYNRKGKVLLYYGLADNLIPPQGSLNYYHRVAASMSGLPEIQKFFRLYLVPGLSHSGALTGGPTVPLPRSPRGATSSSRRRRTGWKTAPGRTASMSLPPMQAPPFRFACTRRRSAITGRAR